MTLDLVVRNGRVALPSGLAAVDVGVTDGRVAVIGEPGTVRAEDAIDARGQLVLPGAVDMHVHFRDPGLEHKEDFDHGTAAAACGGVTTVCDMPNTRPPVVTGERFEAKVRQVAPKAWVDFGLWAGGTAVDELSRMAAAGAVGLKVYMNRPRTAGDPYSNELSMPDDAVFMAVLRASAEIGWPVSVHVASPAIDHARAEELRGRAPDDAGAVCHSYRAPASVEALHRLLLFTELTGARTHVAHVSLNHVAFLDVLAEARGRGRRFTVEVAPPALDTDELGRLGARGVPLAHAKDERARYWRALAEGLVDAVATDHAPHTRSEKDTDVWLAPPGYPGVETSYALVLDAALGGRLTLERAVEVMAAAPARILGLGAKGVIAPGRDADLVLVDPGGEWVVDEAALRSKAGWSPYHGRRLRGAFRATLLRGRLVARDRALVAAAPSGRMAARVPR